MRTAAESRRQLKTKRKLQRQRRIEAEKAKKTGETSKASGSGVSTRRKDSVRSKEDYVKMGMAGAWLGVGLGPSRLPVTRRDPSFRCLLCTKPYDKAEETTWKDRYKSCHKFTHAYCLARAKKCPCGALTPKMS